MISWRHLAFRAAWQHCTLLFAHAPAGLQECASLSLEGPSIQEGVLQLRQALPHLFADALAQLQHPQVAQAAQYHAAFTAWAHPREQSAGGAGDQPKQSVLLPTLSQVLQGRTEPPARLASPAAALEASTASSACADPSAGTSAAADIGRSSGGDKAGQDTATSQLLETQGISCDKDVASAGSNGAVLRQPVEGTGLDTGAAERQPQGDAGSAGSAQDPAAVALGVQPAAVQRLVQVRI